MTDQQEYLQKTIEHCRILARLKRKNQIVGIKNTNVNQKKKSDFAFPADPNLSYEQIQNPKSNTNSEKEQRNITTTKKTKNIPNIIHCRILKYGQIADCFDRYRAEYLEMMGEFWKLHVEPTKTLSNQSTLIKLTETKPIETQFELKQNDQQNNVYSDRMVYSRNCVLLKKFKNTHNLKQILEESEMVDDICIFYN